MAPREYLYYQRKFCFKVPWPRQDNFNNPHFFTAFLSFQKQENGTFVVGQISWRGGGTTPLCIPMGCNDGEMTIEEFRKQQSWQASESCYLCLFWFPRTISDTSLLFSFMLLLLLLLDNCRRRTFRKDETLFSISR